MKAASPTRWENRFDWPCKAEQGGATSRRWQKYVCCAVTRPRRPDSVRCFLLFYNDVSLQITNWVSFFFFVFFKSTSTKSTMYTGVPLYRLGKLVLGNFFFSAPSSRSSWWLLASQSSFIIRVYNPNTITDSTSTCQMCQSCLWLPLKIIQHTFVYTFIFRKYMFYVFC